MRISSGERERIVALVAERFGPGTRVWLFGSRADDSRRGGDVDLYLEAVEPFDPLVPFRAMARLQAEFGKNVDIVIRSPGEPERPIHTIARLSGVELSGSVD